MKKALFSTLILGVTFSGLSVFAANDKDIILPMTPIVSSVMSVQEREDGMFSSRYQKVQLRGDILIKERINSLNANMKVIASDKSLTVEQKAALTAIATTNITGLTALKASIASSTDATSTKNLVNSIFTNFRIYGIVIPQIRLEKRIYDLQNHAGKLSDTFIKVQTKINEYKGKGKDVTVWQKSLDDAKILVANDMNTLANLFTKVSALKPSDYGTSSKATIEQANASLKSVLKDFNTIKKNLHKPSAMGNLSKKDKDEKDNKDDRGGYASPLAKTSWVWASSTISGVTSSAPVGGKFILSFEGDNRVRSTTDCNGIGGNYVLGLHGALTFGQFMSTKMFCEGSQEATYSSQLTKTVSYKVEGMNLILTNASGTMMFVKK